MNLIDAIANLRSTAMLHAVAAHGLGFELARMLLTGFIVAVWTADRSGPRIWK